MENCYRLSWFLNAVTKKLTYTPPAIRKVLDDLVHNRVFSKSDNVGGFYQMVLAS